MGPIRRATLVRPAVRTPWPWQCPARHRAHRPEAEPEVTLLQGVDQSRGDAGAGDGEGCPTAMAPPLTFSFSSSTPSRRADGPTGRRDHLGGKRLASFVPRQGKKYEL